MKQRSPVAVGVLIIALAIFGLVLVVWLIQRLSAVVLVLIAFVLISGVMWLLGMPDPMLLGLMAGAGELVPLLGTFVAGLIAVPIAVLTQPIWVALVLIAFFAVFSQVGGNWLAPKIMQSQVVLFPLATILALMAGASLLGVVGALLEVPLAAGLRVLILRLAVPAIQKAQGSAGQRGAARSRTAVSDSQ